MDPVDGAAPPDVRPPVAGPGLDGIPRPRGATSEAAESTASTEPAPQPPVPQPLVRVWAERLRALLPTPAGTPFTCAYAAVLLVTSAITEYADPSLVHALHQGSSTDVAHLVQHPVLVLFASALWTAGGLGSPYALGLVVVLTALERRLGGVRTAGVFFVGHVLATLATEVPVGLAVLVGHLPESSLHRLDYGISFGVATSVGALAGLLSPWLRWPLLAAFGGMLVNDLITLQDPLTNWGHLMALAIGVALWPVVRRGRYGRWVQV
ncbi:rhomboid-like protein [Streptomyces spongiae]|uniref:rhomboid-like protein n=1 Tax=Streptomyces spongiae TaxID=565072 RepID=UPI00128D6EF4|nr:rhomboid-like protein [Streptomyces spongiae]